MGTRRALNFLYSAQFLKAVVDRQIDKIELYLLMQPSRKGWLFISKNYLRRSAEVSLSRCVAVSTIFTLLTSKITDLKNDSTCERVADTP